MQTCGYGSRKPNRIIGEGRITRRTLKLQSKDVLGKHNNNRKRNGWSYILHLLPSFKALHMKIRGMTKQAKHAVQTKQFWVEHPTAINVTVQAYGCMQKRGTPIGKIKQKWSAMTHIVRDHKPSTATRTAATSHHIGISITRPTRTGWCSLMRATQKPTKEGED